MKFFKSQSPTGIDLLRSLKSDNVDLLQNYIKSNYMQFDFNELVLALPKIQKTNFYSILTEEIKLRIVVGDFMSDYKIDYQLLRNITDFQQVDQLIKLYLANNLANHFTLYNKLEQTYVIHFYFQINQMNPKILDQYLSIFENHHQNPQNEKAFKQFLNELDIETFPVFIDVVNLIKQYMEASTFGQIFTPQIVSHIFSQFMLNLSDEEQLLEQLHINDISHIVPASFSKFFNAD